MKDDLDRAIECVERMRAASKRAGAIARIGTQMVRCLAKDVDDAFDLQKAHERNFPRCEQEDDDSEE